jgi:carbohydrate-binding DOMON domain-containing protein
MVVNITYSKTHQRFADELETQRALEYPEEFLGPNWKDVLNFWWFLDGLSEDQWEIVRQRDWALDADAAYDAAADDAARDAAWDAAGYAYGGATGYATLELIGSHRLLEQGKPITFLPLFLDL